MESAYRKILVAVPPLSREWYQQPADAIRKASFALAMTPDAHLTFLGVFSPEQDLGTGEVNLVPPEELEEIIELHKDRHKARILEYAKWFSDNGVSNDVIAAQGEPEETIIRIAKEVKPDLILLGYHHKTSILDLFTCDIASKVARRAECDVMLIAPKGKTDA